MKIIDTETLMTMPWGTIYIEYMPDVFIGELKIKLETMQDKNLHNFDWDYVNVTPWWYDCDNSTKNINQEYQTEIFSCHDGLYDTSRLFIIFSEQEVRMMINILVESLEKK